MIILCIFYPTEPPIYPYRATVMDSQVQVEGRLLDIVSDSWRKDKLPLDDIMVPVAELPDPEADNGQTGDSLRQQENKWTDLALHTVQDSQPAS